MALINCPECKREISDKVKACPHCGYPMVEEINNETSVSQPVEIRSVNFSKGKFIKTAITITAIIVIAALILFGINYVNEQKA